MKNLEETIDELAGKGARWIKPVALNHKGILMANTGRLDFGGNRFVVFGKRTLPVSSRKLQASRLLVHIADMVLHRGVVGCTLYRFVQ